MRTFKSLYSVKGTAEEIQQCRTTVYLLIGAGILDARKSGRSTRVTGESIERYVEGLPKADIRTGKKGVGNDAPSAAAKAGLSAAFNSSPDA
jgi:hypothetical protein